MQDQVWDVIVVGGGNAGFAAALAAKEQGAEHVLLVEKAKEENDYRGGNSFFTAGAMRTVFDGLDDLKPLLYGLDDATAALVDVDPYTKDDFYGDIMRVTQGRADPVLAKVLVEQSRATMTWMHSLGIQFRLSFHRQAYKVQGRFKFWGGLALSTVDGGKGLMHQWEQAARDKGVKVAYGTPCLGLWTRPDSIAVQGIRVHHEGRVLSLESRGGVILACGGFESSPSLRAQYLGPGWDLAHVRGTPYNTGDGLLMAQRDCFAATAGGWSSSHATCWDANSAAHKGDVVLTNQYTKSGYPLGIMVNLHGERFVDEGMDFRNYTYAVFGKEILKQPDGIVYQVYDQQTIPHLRVEEYADDVVEKIYADTIEELAEKLAGQTRGRLQNRDAFLNTISEYNACVHSHRDEHPDANWNPAIKDGLSTQSSTRSLPLAKSNWALPIEQGPFMAIKITTGITFTFGGLKVDPHSAAVINTNGDPIDGLYACGECVGFFYSNYPGGSGLTLGSILGRKAGTLAAQRAK
ncbi:FAD/NAD(P)-binding domain-containing protein [Gongronella butleri]|nr:FAD/NAD(P)-binding domain-containing protein [Gongronella butleri]